MEYDNNQDQQKKQFEFFPKEPTEPIRGRSNYLEVASLAFGIAAIVCCTCLYLSLIFGAFAILFGVLSRGGENRMGDRAIIGTSMGSLGLGLTAIIYIFCFLMLIRAYGGLTDLILYMRDMSDVSTQELYQDIYEHLTGNYSEDDLEDVLSTEEDSELESMDSTEGIFSTEVVDTYEYDETELESVIDGEDLSSEMYRIDEETGILYYFDGETEIPQPDADGC